MTDSHKWAPSEARELSGLLATVGLLTVKAALRSLAAQVETLTRERDEARAQAEFNELGW